MLSLVERVKKSFSSKDPVKVLKKRLKKGKYDYFCFIEKNNEGRYVQHYMVSRFEYDTITVDAEPVGEERNVVHLSLHDMLESAIGFGFTKIKALEKLNVNAVYIDRDKSKQLEEHVRKNVYQPMFVKNPVEVRMFLNKMFFYHELDNLNDYNN